MSKIVDQIKKELLEVVNQYKITDNYDFWNEHIKYVVDNAIILAKKCGADTEIVELGALLHDISLPYNYGLREEHHIYSAEIAEKLLKKYKYPEEKITRVKKCVFNHRNRQKTPRTSIEEECVADADILSHLENIPMLFSKAYIVLKLSHADGAKYVKEKLKEDYNDLTPSTQLLYKKDYDNVINVLFKGVNL